MFLKALDDDLHTFGLYTLIAKPSSGRKRTTLIRDSIELKDHTFPKIPDIMVDSTAS